MVRIRTDKDQGKASLGDSILPPAARAPIPCLAGGGYPAESQRRPCGPCSAFTNGVTAAFIPCPNPQAVVPGPGLQLGAGVLAEAGVGDAAAGADSEFARLVDAIIGGNPAAYNAFPCIQATCPDADGQNKSGEADSSEDQAAQPGHADILPAGAIVLPTPVPIPAPKTEPGSELGFNMEPDEIETAATNLSADAATPPTGPTGMIPESGHAPIIDVQAEASIAEPVPDLTAAEAPVEIAAQPEPSNQTPTPYAIEPAPRREPNVQPLAFALRLTDLDNGTKNQKKADATAQPAAQTDVLAEKAGPVVEQAVAGSEPPKGPASSPRPRVSAAPSRLVAGNIAEASVKAQAGEDAAPAGRPKVEPAVVARTPEARATLDKAAEHGETQRAVEQPLPGPAPLAVAAADAPNHGAALTGDSRPSPESKAATATAVRTEAVEPVSIRRIATVQPRAVQDVVVQIPIENSRKVEVQVAERAGEVRVAVRTADPELNQALRVELGSLVNRLETAGYRADSLAASESHVSSSSASRQDPSSSEQHGSRGFSGQGQEPPGQGSSGQRRREQETPPWTEQFSNSLKPEQETGPENKSWQSVFRR